MTDDARILDQVLGEADQIIRQRLREYNIEMPHLVVGVTQKSEVVLRSNVSTDCLRSFAEDLNKIADEHENGNCPTPRRWDGQRGA
jgi:hypothetical protein